MTPDQLQPSSFDLYPPLARSFAVEHLTLLRQLPLTICPSFLAQISDLDTRFPIERKTLAWQCDSLAALPQAKRDALLAPLRAIAMAPELEKLDWVNSPAAFVERLSAHLWSTGQINGFHDASRELFAAIPDQPNEATRLALIVVGQGADTSRASILSKLARKGIRLNGVNPATAQQQLLEAFAKHAAKGQEAYAHWYVDGGQPWVLPESVRASAIQVSYPQLSPLRKRVLERMQSILNTNQANAEKMRSDLAAIAPTELRSGQVASDPILQRFYTELFTSGSGTQIFSTSFVQWAGRELARRAQPHTVLLRYTPRQRHRGFNEMVSDPESKVLDPEGSLVDAEMDAYYNWIEMGRIAAPGKLTVLAWVEGSSKAVMVSPKTKPNTISNQAVTIEQALASFAVV
ncbi:MAG: hypothetical protein JF584_17760 [Acidobacteria bacterium]|nr:hypothetical protein [Acidobacteriota bacterium]